MSAVATHRVSSTDGVDLAVHDLGGTGPPLLIVHATGFHGRAYAPLAAALGRSHRVWALDCRGHGASTIADPSTYRWRRAAGDVLACVDWLDAGPLPAVGHSMGGSLVLLAALARPAVFTGAYLYEPILIPGDLDNAPNAEDFAAGARRRRDRFGSRAEALARYAPRPPMSELRSDALWAYVEHGFVDTGDGEVALACRPETEGATFASPDKPRPSELAGLDLRLTVGLGGDNDGPGIADLISAVPGARLITYPHLGHFGPLECPAEIAADIGESLA